MIKISKQYYDYQLLKFLSRMPIYIHIILIGIIKFILHKNSFQRFNLISILFCMYILQNQINLNFYFKILTQYIFFSSFFHQLYLLSPISHIIHFTNKYMYNIMLFWFIEIKKKTILHVKLINQFE